MSNQRPTSAVEFKHTKESKKTILKHLNPSKIECCIVYETHIHARKIEQEFDFPPPMLYTEAIRGLSMNNCIKLITSDE